MAKLNCSTCGRLARPYGKDTCRTCYKEKERQIIERERLLRAELSKSIKRGLKDAISTLEV
jgi:hypothetical protein